jgi:tRNA (cmo5U34)-methyltransferase
MQEEPLNNRNYEIWKTPELSKSFLEGVRSAIPLAAEQIDVLRRIVNLTQSKVQKFLDLGCGDGILGKVIYQNHPGAKGVFLDISEPMLQAAQANLPSETGHLIFILQDFGRKE